MAYQIAQVNIARMRGEIDSPVMADFVANLDRINVLADAAPGFVWRLKSAEGDATSLRVFDDQYLIINMSVWEFIDALFQYAYASDHTDIFRRRGEWFTRMDTPHLALWWVEADQMPTPEEAKAKLETLHAHGASPEAFTFKQRFTVEDWLAHQTAEMK